MELLTIPADIEHVRKTSRGYIREVTAGIIRDNADRFYLKVELQRGEHLSEALSHRRATSALPGRHDVVDDGGGGGGRRGR